MTKRVNKHLTGVKRTGWLWLAGSFAVLLIPAATLRAQTPTEPLLHRCGTAEYERMLQQRDPSRLRRIDELNGRIQRWEADRIRLRQTPSETIYRIPVVVHVVHNTASGQIGGPGNVNISDEQIVSQIQVLNEDYRRKPGTNGFNTNPIGSDARIEFFLARTDPGGQPTSGITRHYYPQKTSFDVFADDVLLSRIAYWPSDRYLNIWVTDVQGSYLGFTQFPVGADTLRGLPGNANEFVDGSIIDYKAFGRQIGTASEGNYALGRTATHEIGHWLGLLHTWGDGCTEDYVADTPPTQEPNANETRECRTTFSNCDGRGQTRDLTEDYMDYSPDACMSLFTKGQVDRMRAVLELSPRRARLLRSAEGPLPPTETLTISVYPNPATIDPAIDVQLKGFQSFTVDLFDTRGRRLQTLQYTDVPSTSVVLRTADLPAGLYIVRVRTDRETASARLLLR